MKISFSAQTKSDGLTLFTSQMVEGYAKMRPFFDYMSEILTTDLNGEEL